MRKDGKFPGADGSIPEGQAIVVAHLSECHELVEMVCLLHRSLQHPHSCVSHS
jgi:hypothetical protein